jgi:polygalacturonase
LTDMLGNPRNIARREAMKIAGLGIAALPLLATPVQALTPARFAPLPQPKIPPLKLSVTDFGAAGDGIVKCTAAIQNALDRCAMLGGGEVTIPAGKFLTGTVFLHSNTRLAIAAGGEIVGSGDLADYPVSQVRWEGKWIQGHCSLIHAIDADNIAIVGPGKITGNAAVGGVPRPGTPLRYPALIEPINSHTLLLDGFSTSYDRMWNIHPTYCDAVTIRNLIIRSSKMGRDGIDIDSCRHVRIDHCDIETGDDCISLKSGRGSEGNAIARPTEDVLISDCTFGDWNWACIGIGSEMSGGIRHVRVERCKFTHAKTHAIYIKGQVGRGAFIEDIEVSDIDVADAVLGFLRLNFFTSGKHDEYQVPGEAGIPHVANFRFLHVRVRNIPQLVEGWEIDPRKPLDGLVLQDIRGECPKGILLANVRNADISGINLTGLSGPLLSLANVTGKGLKGAAPLHAPEAAPELAPMPAEPYRLR